MAQLNTAIRTAGGEDSSREHLEAVGMHALSRGNGEGGELIKVDTVLYFYSQWLREYLGEGHIIYPTNKLGLLRKLVMATVTGLEANAQRRSIAI